MSELTILTGNTQVLRDELGEIAKGLQVRGGDTKLTWDAGNEDEVDAARATFDKLKGKGYAAFAVKKDGEKGQRITIFDPLAQKIIMAPAVRGG